MLSKRSTPQQPRPASTAKRKVSDDPAARAARMADEIAGNLERWRRLECKELEGEAAYAKEPSKERRWESWEALVSCFPTEGYSFLKNWLFYHRRAKAGESIVNQREAIHARDDCLRPGHDAGADPETSSVVFRLMLADLGFHVDDLIRTLRHTAAMIREEALAEARALPRPENVKAARGKKPRRTGSRKPRPVTARQAEAMERVGECKGDVTKAAKSMGVTPKTVRELLSAGYAKLGKSATAYLAKLRQQARKEKAVTLFAELHPEMADEYEGQAASLQGNAAHGKIHRDRRT